MIYTVTLNPCIDRTLTVERFHIGGTFQIVRSDPLPAGKGVNVARVVATLGEPVVALGWVGEGEAASFAAELARAGIENHLVAIPGFTRTNVTILDLEWHTETHLRDRGLEPPPGTLARLEEELERVAAGDWVILAGSLPPGLPCDTYRALIRLCAGRGTRTLLDTSGPPLLSGVTAPPTLLKPNVSELWQIDRGLDEMEKGEEGKRGKGEKERGEGGEAEILAAARRLQAERVPPGADGDRLMVVVSMGERGALGLDRRGCAWHAQVSLDAPAVDTVGSGDALVAGVVTALARGMPFPDALRLGVACGAANALVAGAGCCHRHDIERLAARSCAGAMSVVSGV
jgi:1-phosphofructokinase family hexose kinase